MKSTRKVNLFVIGAMKSGSTTLHYYLADHPDILMSEPKEPWFFGRKGIYVQSLSGGSVNPVTGMFNFTCREAYLIENGKKTMPIRGATLIGSCMDVI
ncbi:MAG: metallopeptidase TldD-related protein, partial [Desulfosarcina sp.]